jgi:hypothetical protein
MINFFSSFVDYFGLMGPDPDPQHSTNVNAVPDPDPQHSTYVNAVPDPRHPIISVHLRKEKKN